LNQSIGLVELVERDRSENTRCHKTACGLCNNLLDCTGFDLYTRQVQIIDLLTQPVVCPR